MSDSDDYFTDDLILDDQTLAVLDSEEQKYLSQVVQPQPPTKRQKTNVGWKPGLGNSTEVLNEPDDLPEVSLQVDGSYGVQRAVRKDPAPPISVANAQTRNFASGMNNAGPSSSRVPQNTSRNISGPILYRQAHNQPPNGFQTRPPPVYRPNSYGPPSRAVSNTNAAINAPHLPPPSSQDGIHNTTSDDLQNRVMELQQKLEQMSKENLGIQAALKEATNARMAKDGEVKILRKTMEKTAQDHAAQITKLKTAKEEADTAVSRTQKEWQDEVERLKSKFVFHELEKASRRVHQTARSKKDSNEQPPSPLVPPSQGNWLTHGNSANVWDPKDEQPLPRPQVPRDTRKAAQSKRSNMLPGFQNAFNDTTPLRPSQERKQRGKQAVLERDHSRVLHSEDTVEDVIMDGPDNAVFDYVSVTNADGDIEMAIANIGGEGMQVDGPSNIEDVAMTETRGLETLDWKRELNRIVLTHSLPSCASLTIQLLFGAPVKTNPSPELSNEYFMACTRIMEVLANTSKFVDWKYMVNSVSQSLVAMIPSLKAAELFLPLAALFNLLALLIYTIPDLQRLLLSQTSDAEGSDCRLLVLLCGICQDQREIAKQTPQEDLARETLYLMQALCINVDYDLVGRLGVIPRSRQALMNMVHASQPSWLWARTTRLLVVIASYPALCRHLLSMRDPDLPPEEKPPEASRIPLIERLCFLLIDTKCKDAEFKDMKVSILAFFAMVATSQPAVHVYLLTATTLVPTLVLFLSNLTSAFWEDDAELMAASPEDVSLAICTLNQTLYLLHFLIFTSVAFLNLRHKLHTPQQRPFNGLTHMFIVTFGRLAYSDPPEWVNVKGQADLVSQTEMAREILDFVVSGPEADGAWQVYRPDAHEADTDVGDMEEELLGNGSNNS